MSWNYRVTKTATDEGDWFQVREVYYLDGGTGWTRDEIAADGQSVEEVRDVLKRMLEACDKPVLDIDDDALGVDHP